MQNSLHKILSKLVYAFNDLQVDYCLIGGFAVSFRAEPRLTRDIDFAVAVDSDEQVEELVLSLKNYGFFVETLLEHKTHSRISTVRMLNTEADIGGIYADLLFYSSGIEKDAVKNATTEEIIPSIRIKVATIPYLIAMKLLSYDSDFRTRDKDDLIGLITESTELELKKSIELCNQIESLGLNRGKDLKKDLEKIRKLC